MNHMKQFFMRPLAVLMSFLMLISVVPVDTWAVPTNTPATTSDEATVPEGLEYEINGEEVTITDYTGSATELIIPDEIEGYPVTSIESYAFYYSESLVSIDVPASIATIGRRAFPEYYQLSDVYYRGTKSQFAAINLDGIQQGFQEALYQVTVHCLDGVYTMVSISTYLDNIYVADGKTVYITIEESGDGLT